MGEETGISWCDATWNPIIGCAKISPGCKNCYADAMSTRYGWDVWGVDKPRTITKHPWRNVLTWNRKAKEDGIRRKCFTGSLFDFFEDHETVNAKRPEIWNVIRDCDWLDFQVLTKRSTRIEIGLPPDWGPIGYPNVWLGVSVENMDYAERVDDLRDIPAAVRFISYEPALGPIDDIDLSRIDWLICGGESGPNFRPMRTEWATAIRDRCKAESVAFWFKQSAALKSGSGTELDGEKIQQFPVPRVPVAA